MVDNDKKFCPFCKTIVKLKEYDKHVSNCSKLSINTLSECTIVKLPDHKINECVMEFKNYKKKIN